MHKMVFTGVAIWALAACRPADAPDAHIDMECASGTRLQIDHRGSAMVLVSVNDRRPIALRAVPAASGVAYKGGGYQFHTKGDEAIWTDLPREASHACHRVAAPR